MEELVPVEGEKDLEVNDLLDCFEKGFPNDKTFYALDLIKKLNNYVSNQELRKGVTMKFLTNWIRNGIWEKGQNPRYSFLVIVNEKELRRWDSDLKLLTFLVPFMQKEKISDLRGLTLFVQKKKDEKDRIFHEFEIIPKKIE